MKWICGGVTLFGVVLVSTLPACSGMRGGSSSDGGTGVSDAGQPDGGGDAGGSPDSGVQDAGKAGDGGAADASSSDGGPGDSGPADGGTCAGVLRPCVPAATETREQSGACGVYSRTRVCGSDCRFGPWEGGEITCSGSGGVLCPGDPIIEACDASGNILHEVCGADGKLRLDHVVYGCTVQQRPGVGTRVCPGATFARACVGQPGVRAKVLYTCTGTLDATAPGGGGFTVTARRSCAASSGPEAGQSFCPGEVIERDQCSGGGLRRFFVCDDLPGEGRSFSALVDRPCGADSGAWVPIHAGVEQRGWVQNGHRFRALRIDLCFAGIAIRATSSAERGKKTTAFGPLVGALAAVNGGYFDPGFIPQGCAAAGNGAVWPDSADNGARSTIFFGPGRVGISEAPNLDVLSRDFPWATEAVCGNATLVRGGVALPDPGTLRRARTAAGFDPTSNTLDLVTVDEYLSSGMSLTDFGVILRDLGLDFAINLDGGGSTTMWIQRKGRVNNPSGGVERTVANHLAVVLDGEIGGTHCH